MVDKMPSLDAMLEKRAEELGTEDRFPWAASEDVTFQVRDPRLLTDEENDDLAELRAQLRDGDLLPSEFNEAFLDLFLGDEQADQFTEMGGTAGILAEVIRLRVEQSDPTQRSSRSTRRRSKRR